MPLRTLDSLAVGSADADLVAVVHEHAQTHGVGERALRLETLLHLPRLADRDGHVSFDVAVGEVAARSHRLLTAAGPFEAWRAVPAPAPAEPSALDVVTADDTLARPLLERFHYLRSFRPSSTHVVGALADGRPAAILSFSPFDLPSLEQALPAVTADETLVLSRVFAFDWVPRNTITYLLRRALPTVRDRYPSARLLLSYVNSNLGFSGASYRAGNWRLLAREHGTRYAYVDGDYVTDRRLAARFGTSDPVGLRHRLGARFASTSMALAPLDVYALGLDRPLRRSLAGWVPLDVPRPVL